MLKEQRFASYLFLLFAVVIFVYSFQYDYSSTIFPMIFSIVTIILSILDITISRLKHKASAENENSESAEKPENHLFNRPFMRLVLWLIFVTIFLKFFSYLFVIPLFLLLLLRFEAKEGWKLSLSVSVGMGIILYLVFSVILQNI